MSSQVRQIARASRSRVAQGQERLKVYRKLLYHAARVLGQARRFAERLPRGASMPDGLVQQAALEDATSLP